MQILLFFINQKSNNILKTTNIASWEQCQTSKKINLCTKRLQPIHNKTSSVYPQSDPANEHWFKKKASEKLQLRGRDRNGTKEITHPSPPSIMVFSSFFFLIIFIFTFFNMWENAVQNSKFVRGVVLGSSLYLVLGLLHLQWKKQSSPY